MLMRLTYDILLHIISFSWNARDVVQLTATCRVLYHEGPKIVLKKVISISHETQLASFLKFLHADNSSRCRYLRGLELWACSPEPDVVQELVETLPLLTNIEYLRLIGADELLDLHLNLMPAFSSLTTLRHINFTGVKGDTFALLSRLRCPLVSANISFISGEDNETFWEDMDDNEWVTLHPTILLHNFASTLEELQCIAWWTIAKPEVTLIPAEVYPNMHKLSIECHGFPLRMDPFIRAFPNLTDLHVNTECHSGDHSEWLRESHETNVAHQVTRGSGGTWEHLEHFRGCLFDLYAVGLTSHIHRVTVMDKVDDGPKMDMLATGLHYARPLHLKLEGIGGSVLGDPDRGFIHLLQDASMSGVVSLDVRVYFGEDDREKDLGAVIDNLVLALVGLPLKFLELRFETRRLDPTPEGPSSYERMVARRRGLPEPPEPTPAPLTLAEISLQTLDMDALIARFESISSLDVAHVVLLNSRYGSDCGWTRQERTVAKGGSHLPGLEQWEN